MSTATRPGLSVCHLPPPGESPTGYVALLGAALRRRGVTTLAPSADPGRWPAAAGAPDVVHLHWLEFIAGSEPGGAGGLARTLRRQLRLLGRLARLRRRGVGIVWTVHNLAPHEPVRPRLERGLARGVMALCDRAIVHSEYAAAQVRRQLGGGDKLTVIPHGNYIGAFPPPRRERDQTRAELRAAPGDFVFLAFGQVRPYKRLSRLLEAFAAAPDARLRLVVAGKPVVRAEAERLRALAAADSRITLDLREIPDAEVADLHAAADAAVFAYGDLFSSGALVLALSQGLPAIVPADSAGSELAGPTVIECFTSGELTAALTRMAAGDRAERRAAALRAVQAHPWAVVAAATDDVYRASVRADAG